MQTLSSRCVSPLARAASVVAVALVRLSATACRNETTQVGGARTGDTPPDAQQYSQRQQIQPTLTRADQQQLLQALTAGMTRTYPGRPLEVIAFYQSSDKLAESLYDPNTDQANVAFVH